MPKSIISGVLVAVALVSIASGAMASAGSVAKPAASTHQAATTNASASTAAAANKEQRGLKEGVQLVGCRYGCY
jgi:IS5 family transposase